MDPAIHAPPQFSNNDLKLGQQLWVLGWDFEAVAMVAGGGVSSWSRGQILKGERAVCGLLVLRFTRGIT